jgi:rare lipoprotein A
MTSSGEVYDMEGMTAAHRTLPFGALVRVENLMNGRSTTLRINDRGPFSGGRVIDLSRWGARELEMLGVGVAPVRVTIIGLP